MELDVFTAIALGSTTPAQVASAASANESATRRLLDALVTLKYLTRKGDRYALTPASATFLVRGSKLYIDDAGRLAMGQMAGWSQLAKVIKSGAPINLPGGPKANGEFFAKLVKCVFPSNYVAAKEVVRSLAPSVRGRIKNALDVAAGAAAWSIPFAQASQATRVTAVDLPRVIPVTRVYREVRCGRPVRLHRGRSARSGFWQRSLRPRDAGACNPYPGA